MSDLICCRPKSLPAHLHVEAARQAIEVNPVNAPAPRALALLSPEHLALVTSKWWGANGVKLTVGFLDNPPADLRGRLLGHMNAWAKSAQVEFRDTGGRDGQVRIARNQGDGYWSYLGTDILQIPANEPTMNLDSFAMDTPDSEFYRVVRHEVGHTLGWPHEHLRAELVARIDPAKAKAYFLRMDGWDAQTVEQQVLTPLDPGDLTATAGADVLSIMCYQLPGEIMVDGHPLPGGDDIDTMDYDFAAKIYPRQDGPPLPPQPIPSGPSMAQVLAAVDGAFAAAEKQARHGLIGAWLVKVLQQLNVEVDTAIRMQWASPAAEHPLHSTKGMPGWIVGMVAALIQDGPAAISLIESIIAHWGQQSAERFDFEKAKERSQAGPRRTDGKIV